jgi:hypothetical protein
MASSYYDWPSRLRPTPQRCLLLRPGSSVGTSTLVSHTGSFQSLTTRNPSMLPCCGETRTYGRFSTLPEPHLFHHIGPMTVLSTFSRTWHCLGGNFIPWQVQRLKRWKVILRTLLLQGLCVHLPPPPVIPCGEEGQDTASIYWLLGSQWHNG